MEDSKILEKVIKVVATKKSIDPSKITAETTFAEIEADSLDTVEIIMDIESEFGFELGNQDTGAVSTIGEVVAIVKQKLAEKK